MPYPFYQQNYVNPYQASYYPATYQPATANQFGLNQPTQSFSSAPTSSSIIWISGLQEAQMYPIAPNNAVALWEKSGKTIYLKSADATGRPSITVYDLVERTAAPGEASTSDGKEPTYASKADLATVAGIVKDLTESVDQIKSDMYGIAGKKRSAKKQTEGAEDDE